MSILYLQYAGIIGDYHIILASVSQTSDLCYLLLRHLEPPHQLNLLGCNHFPE